MNKTGLDHGLNPIPLALQPKEAGVPSFVGALGEIYLFYRIRVVLYLSFFMLCSLPNVLHRTIAIAMK